jgi:hypothetical protein
METGRQSQIEEAKLNFLKRKAEVIRRLTALKKRQGGDMPQVLDEDV